MNKVKIGIIGMGRMGLTHYPIINTHPNVEIVSVSDTSEVILGMLKKYIPGLKTYTDFNALLDAKDVDGVIVCTPSLFHYDICRKAGENNISVFCEKPFTTSPEHAQELADLFSSKGLINQVGYVNRYNAAFIRVKQYLRAGVIGELMHVKGEFFSATITKPQSSKGWRSSRQNGGGATYEMGAHILDLLNYLLGEPTSVDGAIMNNVFSESVEDMFSTNLSYPGGVTANVFVNWSDATYRKPMMKLEFYGSHGKIMADMYGIKIYVSDAVPEFELEEGWNTVARNTIPDTVPFYVRGNGYTHQLYDFADAISTRKQDGLCSFNDAASTQRIIHKIFSTAQ